MASDIVGRAPELRAIDEAVATLDAGHSACLVFRGEPGIGKSRLLQHALDTAHAATTLRAVGVELETTMAFAGLHQTLLPLLPTYAERLPDPQRKALDTAFGQISGPPPDRFLVGLSVLTLLSEAARAGPILVVVDDVHWLDPESVAVLAFVARRLAADPVVMVFAVREEPAESRLNGVPSVVLSGLDEPAVDALITARTGVFPQPVTVRAIVAGTGGNPLVVTELIDTLSVAQLTAGAPLPATLPLASALETYFGDMVRDLPPDTRTVLLIAAADTTDDSAVLSGACERFGLTLAAADPAIAAGVFSLEGGPSFRHPLIRSAVHGAATGADLRRVHHALASVTDVHEDPDRRAWHLAAATAGPDRDVADHLERAAGRAGARGGYSQQAAFLARAAELSPDRTQRSRRKLAAAQAHLVADDLPAARRHLDDALTGLREPDLLVRAQRLRATVEIGAVRPARAPEILVGAMAGVRDREPDLAWDMGFEAFGAAMLAGEFTDGITLHTVAVSVLDLPPRKGPTTVADLLATALAARIVHGHRAAVPLLRRAVEEARHAPDPVEISVPLAILGATAAAELWDGAARHAITTRLARHNRRRGAVRALRVSLEIGAASEIWAGDFAAATVRYAESESLDRDGGSDQEPVHRVELLAWQGHTDLVRETTALMISQWGPALRIGAMEQLGHLASAVVENAAGHYDRALVSARRLYAVDPLGLSSQALPEIVEAGARGGDHTLAQDAVARLSERARAAGQPWGLGLLARCEAMIAGDDAEPLYREALDLLARTRIHTETARTHLLYGEWLRRHHRVSDARRHLQIAHGAFDAMGAGGFRQRAAGELRAAGGTSRPTTNHPRHALTPQETQIAQLAAAGHTNREIATELFLTASTVEYHLTKIFRKLDITSRRKLGRRLEPERPAVG